MQQNNQWITENTPRGRFFGANDGEKDTKTVILCGRVKVGKSRKSPNAVKKVRFGKAFAPNCRPNVTTGTVSDGERKIFVVVNGPDGKTLPEHSGCEIQITVPGKKNDKWKIKKPFYVYWQAYGFRKDDMNEF